MRRNVENAVDVEDVEDVEDVRCRKSFLAQAQSK